MNEPSEEQQIIINHIKNGDNVAVDACAGSGKSTTILSCAKSNPLKQFLILTYNSALRLEMAAKIRELNLQNLEVHTYHSLAVKYFLPSAHTDTGLRTILYNKMIAVVPIPAFQIIVLDEAQDITFLYHQFIVYYMSFIANPFQLLILGDWMQGLYEFKGADIRFLTMADKIWSQHPGLRNHIFHKCTLRMSYRITNQMAKFVNNVMLGENRMLACRDGPRVTYIRYSPNIIEKIVVYRIGELLSAGAKPSDIFILGGSVNGAGSNIRKMENILVEAGIPTHVPMIELADKIDDRVMHGKVVFSSFHSVKGRQRKYVFIVGFDNSYFTYCAKNLDSSVCPNTLYVAATRATNELFLLENNERATDRPLDFLKKTHNQMKQTCTDYIDFKGSVQSLFYESVTDAENRGIVTIPTYHLTPTSLIKFIPESVIEEITPLLDRIFIRQNYGAESGFIYDVSLNDRDNEPNPLIIPSIIQTEQGFHEDVSDLNGIAIPNIYFDYITKTDASPNMLYNLIAGRIRDMKPNEHKFLKALFADLSPECNTPADYLHMANMYVSIQERLYYRLKQIGRHEYTWLTDEMLANCKRLLDATIGAECADTIPATEQTIIHYNMEAEHVKTDALLKTLYGTDATFRFSARIDALTDKTIWELKCTRKLSTDNLLQVVIYAWIWRTTRSADEDKRFVLLNIKTGEMLELNASKDELDTIVVALLKGKYGKTGVLTNDEFLANTGH